jgi:acyl carrier protein
VLLAGCRPCPFPAAFAWHHALKPAKEHGMTERAEVFEKIAEQIEPYNKKVIVLDETTSFAADLEWDSLTVMDFVAAIEDEFDIIITMNMQAEIETVGQLVDSVIKLQTK